MAGTDFREQSFRGTLRELLEEGKLETQNSASKFLEAHTWLRDQLLERYNILPVRAFGEYRSRGRMYPLGANGSSFMPVDNEPLASLYQHWIQLGQIPYTIASALAKGLVVASWRCDESALRIESLRFKGAKTAFRDRGLKLAHINDAALGLSTSIPLEEQIAIRFMRSLSPLNSSFSYFLPIGSGLYLRGAEIGKCLEQRLSNPI